MDKEDIKEILQHKDLREIWLFIDEILASGLTVDELLDFGEPYDGYFEEHSDSILDYGADPMKLFLLNEEWYRAMSSLPEMLCRKFAIYLKYGLDPDYLKKWLETNISGENLVKYSDSLCQFGIKAEEHKAEYFKRYCFGAVWDDLVYGDAPDGISVDDAIEYYRIEEIAYGYNHTRTMPYSGFSNFIREFVKLGGDIEHLADKYLQAYCYPEDDTKLIALATLKNYGATNVDANKIIDALTYKSYSYKDKNAIRVINEHLFGLLRDYADALHLARLKAYH